MNLIKSILNNIPIKVGCFIQSLFLSKKMTIGNRSYIHRSVHLLGKKNIHLGSNSGISENCWLNVNNRKVDAISIHIGNNCFIGKSNFFTSGNLISIGDYTLTAIGCKFIGSTHIIENPTVPYISSGTTTTNNIEIGANCFIGAETTVLGNIKIGHGSVTGANSFVINDIPPFSLVIGNPAKIIKRYSFKVKKWIPISDVLSEFDLNIPHEEDYLKMLNLNTSHISMPWIAIGKSMGDI